MGLERRLVEHPMMRGSLPWVFARRIAPPLRVTPQLAGGACATTISILAASVLVTQLATNAIACPPDTVFSAYNGNGICAIRGQGAKALVQCRSRNGACPPGNSREHSNNDPTRDYCCPYPKDKPVVGGAGARSNVDRCPSGEFLVGFNYRAGAWMDQISVICAPLLPSKQIGNTHSLPARGGRGGEARTPLTCARPDELIYSIKSDQTTGDHAGATHVIEFTCFTTTPVQGRNDYSLSFGGVVDHQANYAAGAFQSCERSDAAVGLHINHGEFVNGIGLLCGPLPPAAACAAGQVWRERFEGDGVCVTPDERFRLADGTCRAGYVWIGVPPVPNRCVTPAQRASAQKAAAKDESDAARAKLLGGVADFAGTWDTRTGQGGHFLLTLTVDGDTVTGTFTDLNGNPKYDGTLTGSWKNDHISHTWTQPQTGVSGKGTFKVYTDGKLDGGITYKPEGSVQGVYIWWRGERK